MTDPYSEQTPEGGVPLAGDDPVLLKDPISDALMRMVTEITAELWVERERRLALEAVLQEAGLLSSDAVENYRPTEAQAAEIKRQRNELVKGVFKELRRMAKSAGE